MSENVSENNEKRLVLEEIQRSCQDHVSIVVLDSVQDFSKGCDQFVYFVSRERLDSLIIKYPKEEKDKIEKQVIMAENSARYGFNSSTVLHHTADYLIEKYIPGESLSVEKHGNCKVVWIELGRQMKLVHTIPGDGFSNRIRGETSTKFPIYNSYYDKMVEGLKWEDSHVIPGVDRYLTEMLQLSKSRIIATVHLHYDVAFDNVIVTTHSTETVEDVGQTVTMIDFADAGMGDKWEDFAFLYCNLFETPRLLEYIFEGYGNVETENIVWIEFYCVVWLTWALSGDDQPEKRVRQLRVAEKIVEKGLIWLDSMLAEV